MIEIGQVISGKYRLLRLLGDGGMGSVYEAQHEVLGTRVAIKVLHADLARRSGLIDRFLQEARVAAQIKSAHVVQVTDVDRTPSRGSEAGLAYIVMELLQGEALSAVLERDRKVPLATAVDYTVQILEALEAAHALGVTHRDLKPENVFVTFSGGKPVIKLIDFGIAKLRSTDPQAKNLTVAGVVMGTAEYMAPEQAHSADKADARSDIYAVGVMLYEMIAGTRPVDGDDGRMIAARVERGDVKPLVHAAPDVPRELAGLVHRAMAARPELRFATATEMRLALEQVARTKDHVAPRPLDASSAPDIEMGPGTVLGAPAESVFLSPASPPGVAPAGLRTSGAGHTAPPAVDALWPAHLAVHSETIQPQYGEYQPSARRKKRSLGWLILVLPLLLGIGAVVALVVGNSQATSDVQHIASAPQTSVSVTPTIPTTIAVAPTDTVAPLVTTRPTTPVVTGRPSARPTSQPSGSPPGKDDNPPVITFPSCFPFPIPSIGGVPPFPSTFPSVFPFPPLQQQATASPPPAPSI